MASNVFSKEVSHKEFMAYAKGFIESKYGTQKSFAKANGLSPSYVSDVLSNKREPGKSFLSAIGAEKVVSYKVVFSDEAIVQ